MKRWLADRRLFKAAYMLFLLIQIIPMVNHWRYADGLLLVFMLWGYGLLAVDVVRHRLDSFRGRAFVPLLLFFVLCGISLLLNPQNALFNSLLRLGIFFLCGAVLYITPRHDPEALRREAVGVATVYVAATAVMAAVSVAMYLVQFQYQFTGPLGENIRIGVWENRLFGLFTSGNLGGSLMAIGLLLSLGLLGVAIRRKKLTVWRLILLLAAAVLQLWHMALTLSRGTVLSLLAAGVVLCGLCPLGWGHRLKEMAGRVVCLVLAVAVLWGSVTALRQLSLVTVRQLADWELVESEVTGFDRIEYDDTGDLPADISNKRFAIWRSTWHLTRGKWLCGTGRNYYEYLRVKDTATWLTEEDHVYLEWSKGNTHNGYLQILADSGVLALLAYAVFLGWCLVTTVRAYVRAPLWGRRVLALTTATVVYVLVNNLFESNMVLMSTNPIQAIFWFAAGIHMAVCYRLQQEKEGGKTS